MRSTVVNVVCAQILDSRSSWSNLGSSEQKNHVCVRGLWSCRNKTQALIKHKPWSPPCAGSSLRDAAGTAPQGPGGDRISPLFCFSNSIQIYAREWRGSTANKQMPFKKRSPPPWVCCFRCDAAGAVSHWQGKDWQKPFLLLLKATSPFLCKGLLYLTFSYHVLETA